MSFGGGPSSPESERLEEKRAEIGGKIEKVQDDLKNREGDEVGGYGGALFMLQEELDRATEIDQMIQIGRDVANIANDVGQLPKK